VKKNGNGNLQAHAWIESDNQIIIGGRDVDLEKYIPLLEYEENIY
jgi:hypothetical protein